MATLKELRTKRGLTLDQVASAVGIAPSTLSKLERGQHKLNESFKTRLEQYYGESFEFYEYHTYMEYKRLQEEYNQLQQAFDDLLTSYQEQLEELRIIRNITCKY